MENQNKDVSNLELLEFIKENVTMKSELETIKKDIATKNDLAALATKDEVAKLATKEDLNKLDDKVINRLDGISKQLTDLATENVSNISAHKRFEHRDEAFAKNLHLDLAKIDTES